MVCQLLTLDGESAIAALVADVSRMNLLLYPVDHKVKAGSILQIGKDKRSVLAHKLRITVHALQRCADIGGEVDLVDEQQVRACDARTTFAWHLVAGGDIQHVNPDIDQFGAKGGGDIVATAL